MTEMINGVPEEDITQILRAKVEQLEAENKKLRSRNRKLKAEIKQLEEDIEFDLASRGEL